MRLPLQVWSTDQSSRLARVKARAVPFSDVKSRSPGGVQIQIHESLRFARSGRPTGQIPTLRWC